MPGELDNTGHLPERLSSPWNGTATSCWLRDSIGGAGGGAGGAGGSAGSRVATRPQNEPRGQPELGAAGALPQAAGLLLLPFCLPNSKQMPLVPDLAWNRTGRRVLGDTGSFAKLTQNQGISRGEL